MIGKLAQMVGLPNWAVKIGLAVLAAFLLLWAYTAWRDRVIDQYEASLQTHVATATDSAKAKADAQLDQAAANSLQQMEQDRRDIENARQENRSPLDALFD
jgi:Flp pilus assembly protein TadB